jgi:hypothetical protein
MIQSSAPTRFEPTAPAKPTIGRLFKDLATDSRALIQQEIELAKAEMSEKASVYARNAAYLAIGGLVLYAGLLALIAAGCIGLVVALDISLETSTAIWLGPLLVGAVVALVGYAFVQKAFSTFKSETLAPRKTIDSIRENTEWLKEQVTISDTRMPR